MTTKQIRSVAELPRAFELSKYARTSTFDIVDWTINLELRTFAAYLIDRKQNTSGGTGALFMEKLLTNPLAEYDKRLGPDNQSQRYLSNVEDFTASDYLFGGVEDDRCAKYKAAFDRQLDTGNASDEDRALLDQPLWMMLRNCGIGYEDSVAVTVDLHGSEEKILGDFAKWLRRTRDDLSLSVPRRHIKSSEFADWNRFALLPYLDLTMWATAHDAQISQQVMGVCLFPHELDVNVSERIRRVVAPLARTICTESFSDALRVQTRAEIAEGKIDRVLPRKFSFVGHEGVEWVPIMPDTTAEGPLT